MSLGSPSLPTSDAVVRTLRDLFGQGIQAKKGAAPPAAAKVFIGLYADNEGEIAVACICDVPLAATFGAALAMIPAPVAAEAVRLGKLSADMTDNLREVLNIMASQFGAIHVRMTSLVAPGEKLAPQVSALIAKPATRLDLEIAVAGYVGGRLALLGR